MSEIYDPYDPVTQENPYPVYVRLRDEIPVYRNEERGFWAISRFDDIWMAVHDPARFSSAQGILIGQDLMNNDMVKDIMPMFVMMDPPRHDQLRKFVNRAFTPRSIAKIEANIRIFAEDLLGSFRDRGSCDLVKDFAGPLPMVVIAQILGVPIEDREQFREWSDLLVQVNPDDPASIDRALTGAAALYEYFPPMLEARRSNPADDLMSELVTAEIDGVKLSHEELLGICFLLLVAGNETTTNLISNAAVVLHQLPELRRRLAGDLSLIPTAVEEILRFESPVQGMARTLTTDVEMHGVRIPEGDKVLLLFASANRDEREFERADEFMFGRQNDRMLSFGHGVHYCVGAALARMECRIAYEVLLTAIPEYDLGKGGQRLLSGPIRGFKHLPIEFDPGWSAGGMIGARSTGTAEFAGHA